MGVKGSDSVGVSQLLWMEAGRFVFIGQEREWYLAEGRGLFPEQFLPLLFLSFFYEKKEQHHTGTHWVRAGPGAGGYRSRSTGQTCLT